MAQQGKVLVAKPGKLSSIPGTHTVTVTGENWLLPGVL